MTNVIDFPTNVKYKVLFNLPQGKVIQQALSGMGFNNIDEVRQGKYFEIDVQENDPKKANEIIEEICKKLLANLVIENYKIIETQ